MEHLVERIADKVLDRIFGDEDDAGSVPSVGDGRHIQTVKVGFAEVDIYESDIKEFGVFVAMPMPYIIINEEITGWIKIQTIWHELNHAAAFIFSHSDRSMSEEEWVDFSAAAQCTIMRDNPKFIGWLLGLDKKKSTKKK